MAAAAPEIVEKDGLFYARFAGDPSLFGPWLSADDVRQFARPPADLIHIPAGERWPSEDGQPLRTRS